MNINNVKTKLFIVFLIMILLLVISFGIIFFLLERYSRNVIYQQMENSARYYVDFTDNQMENILQQRDNFFTDRNLVFLGEEGSLLDHDRMAAILTEQEKLLLIKGSNKIIKDVIVYITGSDIIIKSDALRTMTDTDRQRINQLNKRLDVLTVEDGVLTLAMAEHYYSENILPRFYLEIIFDEEQIISNLNDFSIEGGSSFWDYPLIGWFLENPVQEGMGRKILKVCDETEGISRINVDGKYFLVNVTESKYFGKLIQYCNEDVILQNLRSYRWQMICFLLLAVVCAMVFASYTDRLINRPLRELQGAFQKLEDSDLSIRITNKTNDEFEYIYDGFNHMVEKLSQTIDEVYVQKNLAAQAQFKQLQAQINPHFLYNSFFLLNGRIHRHDYEGAELLTNYLGTYFRYITRNASDIATLSEELEHAEAYARIQESRFSARMELDWEKLPEEWENILIPRLTVQPILENAFKYALENKEEDGLLHVYYLKEAGMRYILVEDNGDISDEAINEMNRKFSIEYQGEITGIINVDRRLKSYYKCDTGLSVQRGELGWVLVKILIPERNNQM